MENLGSRLLIVASCVAIFYSQTACVTTPTPVRQLTTQQTTAHDVAQLGTIGFAVGQFQPVTVPVAPESGLSAGAVAGAAGIVVFVPLCVLIPECLLRMTVGTAQRASRGGVKVAPAEPDEETAAAASSFKSELAQLRVQEGLRKALEQYFKESGLRAVMMRAEQGPTAPDLPQIYAAGASGVDTVLEASVIRLNAGTLVNAPDTAFVDIHVNVRLVRVKDNTVLDSFVHRHRSANRKLGEWQAVKGKAMMDDLERAHREIAEQVIDELLLIYYAPKPAENVEAMTGATRRSAGSDLKDEEKINRIPWYAVRPIYPEVVTQVDWKLPQMLKRIEVDSVQPTLRWEAFPRTHDFPSGKESHRHISDVTYELKLYRSLMGGDGVGEEFYNRTGLSVPSHRVEQKLEFCKVYYWTVRARFKIDGIPRVTEWTGAYTHPFGNVNPHWWRRSEYSMFSTQNANKTYYLPFRAPAQEGIECSAS